MAVMNDLVANQSFTEADVQQVVAGLLQFEQPDLPVTHHFGPGVYIREIMIPSDTVIVGHYHRNAHLNVMLTGRLTLINMDGTRRELVAPQTLMSQPGRKIAIVHEEVHWQNIYATDETDVERLEEMLFDKAEADMLALANQQLLLACDHSADQVDFVAAIAEFGFDEETVWAISSDESDLIPLPFGSYGIMVGPSPIHGKGLFATSSFEPGDVIALAAIDSHRTPPGRYTNHAARPNAEMIRVTNGRDMELRAILPIAGSKGGSLGDEVTVDYRQVLALTLGAR